MSAVGYRVAPARTNVRSQCWLTVVQALSLRNVCLHLEFRGRISLTDHFPQIVASQVTSHVTHVSYVTRHACFMIPQSSGLFHPFEIF